MIGDGTELDLLENESIGSLDALVSVTGFDDENILISLYCKKVQVPYVITKVSRSNYLGFINKLGMDAVLSTVVIRQAKS